MSAAETGAASEAGRSELVEAERIVPGTEVWDASYPDHIQRYRFALDFIPQGATVLDAGCGVGYGAAEIADNRGARVVAVDIAQEALDLAAHHFDRPAITWCRDDCHRLEAAAAHGPFDAIINFENIEHLERPEDFVARAAALLKPGGTLLTSTPNRRLLNHLRGVPRDAPSSNQYHLNEMSEAEFRTLLGRHFEDVQIRFQSVAGAAGIRLRLRSASATLRILPLLRGIRRMIPGSGAGRKGSAQPRTPRTWTLGSVDTGAAWTLIAICRSPRVSKRQHSDVSR